MTTTYNASLDVDEVIAVADAASNLSTALPRIIRDCNDPEGLDLAQLLDVVRQARQLIAKAEGILEWETAQAMMENHAENATVRVERTRRPVRTTWAHLDWQADVRRKIIQSHGLKGAHVVSSDGEELDVSLEAVIRQAQEMHGSTAPRTSHLRTVGLDPDDYCERRPGSWSVEVVPLLPD